MMIHSWKSCTCGHRADWHVDYKIYTIGVQLFDSQVDNCRFAPTCECNEFRFKDNLEYLESKYENSLLY